MTHQMKRDASNTFDACTGVEHMIHVIHMAIGSYVDLGNMKPR